MYVAVRICKLLLGILFRVPQMSVLNRIVVPKISACWEDVAYCLDFEIPTVDGIGQKHKFDPKRCCMETLKHWLIIDIGSGLKTWTTLLNALKQIAELRSVVSQIEDEVLMLG